MKWARVGDAYTVELVERVDPDLLGYASTNGETPGTCGDGLDLALGDRFELRAESRLDPRHHDECFLDCYGIYAVANLARVALHLEELPNYHILGGSALRGEGRVDLPGVCKGSYQLGIDELTGEQQRSERFATDHVFFRGYTTSSTCLGTGSEPEELAGGGFACGDVWVVRIRNEQGELLSRDL